MLVSRIDRSIRRASKNTHLLHQQLIIVGLQLWIGLGDAWLSQLEPCVLFLLFQFQKNVLKSLELIGRSCLRIALNLFYQLVIFQSLASMGKLNLVSQVLHRTKVVSFGIVKFALKLGNQESGLVADSIFLCAKEFERYLLYRLFRLFRSLDNFLAWIVERLMSHIFFIRGIVCFVLLKTNLLFRLILEQALIDLVNDESV